MVTFLLCIICSLTTYCSPGWGVSWLFIFIHYNWNNCWWFVFIEPICLISMCAAISSLFAFVNQQVMVPRGLWSLTFTIYHHRSDLMSSTWEVASGALDCLVWGSCGAMLREHGLLLGSLSICLHRWIVLFDKYLVADWCERQGEV